MKRKWKVEVWIDEELEGWSVGDQLTVADIEDEVSEALKKAYDNIQGVEFVDCEVEEVKKDE